MNLPSTSVRRSLCALLLLGALAGCENLLPQQGYRKLAWRTRDDIPRAAVPNPPPVVAGIGAAGGAAAKLPANAPAGVTQEMVDAGQQQYGTVCAACHGPGGAGTPAAPALNDAQWLNISGAFPEIVATINNGVTAPKQFPAPMPPKGGGNFNDEQVRAIAAYVFAISHQ
jgi:mono/diheme cytochrome c family protein